MPRFDADRIAIVPPFQAAESGSPPVVNAGVRGGVAPERDGKTTGWIALWCDREGRCHVALVLPPRRSVDCWIGVVQEADRRIVRLAGRLGVAQVPELLRACGAPGNLQLDLSDLVSADVAGLEALQRARARGALLVGVPGYIQLKLDTPA